MTTKPGNTTVTDKTSEHGATQAATNGTATPEPKKSTPRSRKAPNAGDEPKEVRQRMGPKGGTLTLAELAKRYLEKLEADGKSAGTQFSYKMELRLALEVLGEKTSVAKLTRPKVQAFFESEAVTKTRTGVPKSPLSIAKTTRVLRQALAYAVELGVIEKAPLPE